MFNKITTEESEKDEKKKKIGSNKLTTAKLEKQEKNKRDVFKSFVEGQITRSDAIAMLWDYGWSVSRAKVIVSQWIEQAKLEREGILTL